MIRGQAEAAPFTYVLFCVIYKGAFDTANPCGLDVRLLFFAHALVVVYSKNW